jgi:hypothetical protein
MLAVSIASRFARSLELRVTDVTFDKLAQLFTRDVAHRTIRFIANEPDRGDRAEYGDKLRQISRDNDLTDPNDVLFIEVTITDPSEFDSQLHVMGEIQHGRYHILSQRPHRPEFAGRPLVGRAEPLSPPAAYLFRMDRRESSSEPDPLLDLRCGRSCTRHPRGHPPARA